MSSLVADYGSSSGSDVDSDTERESSPVDDSSSTSVKVPLPRPNFSSNAHATKDSVFLNPYVEAENAKKAILEKHVKMVPSKDEVRFINGKQICWNYRKGRCRFGHTCKFAHDSDLHQSGAQSSTTASNQIGQVVPDVCHLDDETEAGEALAKRKKRPGLTQTLVPGKKVLNMYKRQKRQESPWKT